MSTATRRGFIGKYDGTCATCTAPIAAGDEVFQAPGNEGYSGLQCCGDRGDDELVAHQRADDNLTVDDEDPADAIAQVMPRNRTARDACPKCWIIPAANGACNCDA